MRVPPCLRDCRGVSVLDATMGDIFVPNLFTYGGLTDLKRPPLCNPLALSARAAAQSRALRASLPPKFICVHWRAGDFLSTMPLSRLRGKAMISLNTGLASGSFMAKIAARAARAVGASHVLVLTNARWERTHNFSRALELENTAPRPQVFRHGRIEQSDNLTATILSCSDAPPDSEKEVCATGASALLLSYRSSFSTHILRMARAYSAAHDLPEVRFEYISSCRRSWQDSKLLSGPPIAC